VNRDSLQTPETGADELFVKLNKSTLVNNPGRCYSEFRKKLVPQWSVVWRDLTLGWLALAAIVSAEILFSNHGIIFSLLGALVGAVLIGFTLAYIMLFLHEAAHWNIHPDKKWNDLLCNVFCCGIGGMDVQSYRLIHWEHHRHFGESMDTEVTYRDPLNLRFIVESLLGIRALKVVLLRRRKLQASGDKSKPRLTSGRYALLGGMAFNGIFLLTLLYVHQWGAIASWVCGVLVFFPFFGALRQLLEHRGELLGAAAKRGEAIYFATNRLFGDGLIASTFGGAGFNRHLLHHWEPQISYTRLHELEDFLLDTEASTYLRARRTTYWRTFTKLFFAVPSR
jgi:fatty acid desaturase